MSNWTTCIRIERTDGTIYGLTELDQDLTIFGLTYVSAAGYTPSNYSSSDKMSVNHADIEGVLSVLGVTREDIRAGLFDFAELEFFIWDYKIGTRVKTIGYGNWGEVTLYDGRYTAEFRSLTQRLQQTSGHLYTPHCTAQLGDKYCKIDLTETTVTGTLTAVDNRLTIYDTSRIEADNYWNAGIITFTSGDNINRSFEVDYSKATGLLKMFLPLSFPAAVGDTYKLVLGCDKSVTTCETKFSNVINFRGFPHVPGSGSITRVGKQGYYPACWEPNSGRDTVWGRNPIIGAFTESIQTVVDASVTITELIAWGESLRDIDTNLVAPNNTYNEYTVVFTSGTLVDYPDVFKIVTQLDTGRITLTVGGYPYAPEVGDMFDIVHEEPYQYASDGGG